MTNFTLFISILILTGEMFFVAVIILISGHLKRFL